MKIQVLLNTNEIIAVTKPSGLLVHPNQREAPDRITLMSLTRNQIQKKVYPLHRLDRPASGVVLFAKHSEFVHPLQLAMACDESDKIYLALVYGKILYNGRLDSPLKHPETKIPKESLTLYEPLAYNEQFNVSLLKINIKTGRYHQIRRHFRKIVMPLVGDTKHGKGIINRKFREVFNWHRLFLHACLLRFINPFTNQLEKIESPLEKEMEVLMTNLFTNKELKEIQQRLKD